MASSDAGNWSENPYNFDTSIKSYSTANLLFNECHRNCVDFGSGVKPAEQDMKCISNCQAKTHQAFDMYMRVQYNFSKKKSPWDYIDMSSYTGMEVEHGSNTAYMYPESSNANLGHFDPKSNDKLNNYRQIEKNLSGLRHFRDTALDYK